MPTLLDLLEGFGSRMDFNLELKVGLNAPYDGLEERVFAEVEARGLLPRMLFSSFDDGVLARLRAVSSAARIAVLVSPRAPRDVLGRAGRVGAEAVNPHCLLVAPGWVSAAHEAGLAVYPYTARLRELLDSRDS